MRRFDLESYYYAPEVFEDDFNRSIDELEEMDTLDSTTKVHAIYMPTF